MDLREIVVVDIETTGLHPYEDEVWEVAAIKIHPPYTGEHPRDRDLVCRVWQLPINLDKVSDWVKENTGIVERYNPWTPTPVPTFLRDFKKFVDGRHLAGNVVSFDAQRLERLYLGNGYSFDELPWHYHLIDVEAVAIGAASPKDHGRGFDLPWDSRQVSEHFAVTPPGDQQIHQAYHDALWAFNLLMATVGHTPRADFDRVH